MPVRLTVWEPTDVLSVSVRVPVSVPVVVGVKVTEMVHVPWAASVLPTGQVVGVIDELPSVAEVAARVVREAEETLARLCAS